MGLLSMHYLYILLEGFLVNFTIIIALIDTFDRPFGVVTDYPYNCC